MKNGTADIVYRCKDCSKYNLCSYYYRRKETSQICHYFELPERKMGKWIETGYIDGTNVLDGKCSYCGEWIDVKRKSVVGCLRYCPFCGEKMEVDE